MIKKTVEYTVACSIEMCNNEAQGEDSLDTYRGMGWFITDNEQFCICPKCMRRQKVGVTASSERDKIFDELTDWVNAFDTAGEDITPVQALAIANYVITTFRANKGWVKE